MEHNQFVRELRRDVITGRWVVVNTELARVPGTFVPQPEAPCRICADAGSDWRVKSMPNFTPALRVEGHVDGGSDGPYDWRSGVGANELLIETPEHGVRLAELPEGRLEEIFETLRTRMLDLRRDERLLFFSVFRGPERAHGAWEIVGLPVLPDRWVGESVRTYRYYEARGRCVTCDLIEKELASGGRVIKASDECVVLAPYASRNPFEIWILPRKHGSHFENGTDAQLRTAGAALRDVAQRIDAVLEKPDVLVTLQTAGSQEVGHHGLLAHAHWRLEVTPRLMAGRGFESAAQAFVNPVAPEEAARYLREAWSS